MKKKTRKPLNKNVKRIILLTAIYFFILITFLTPFMTVEGVDKTSRYIGFIITGLISFFYLLTLIVFLWDYIKERGKKE